MRYSKFKQIETKVDDAIECDICHEKYLLGYVENESTYEYNKRTQEINEFMHIYHQCGYGSKHFEDGFEIELDICQDCVNKILYNLIMDRKKKEENEVCSNS